MKTVQVIDGADNANFSLFQAALWQRPILKRDAGGIHGTLFYDNDRRRPHIPASKRECDYGAASLSPAQRELFAKARAGG